MSAFPGHPHRIRDAERTVVRTVADSFWTAVALVLGLLAFFAVAGGSAVITLPVLLMGVALLVLWGLHVGSVRRHAVEERHDERWRHARERRGF
jgi:fatty acid desaturase